MVEITKKAEYAISALVELSLTSEEYVSSKEIANRQQIPPNFLPQIIAMLGTRGWVEGVRGPGGGIKLMVDPEKISIRDIVELIEGPVAITRCLLGDGGCSHQETCPLHPVWERAQEAMLAVLSETTLANVADSKCAMDQMKRKPEGSE